MNYDSHNEKSEEMSPNGNPAEPGAPGSAGSAEIDGGDWKRKTVLFLSSQGLSLLGSMLVQYAIMWHITLTTGSGLVLTLSTIFSFLPQIIISLYAGVWADRYDRRFLIIFSDTLTAFSTLILAVSFLLGFREIWLILLVAAIRSIGSGIQSPAVNALLPQIVPGERLMKVNGLNATVQPFIMIISPVVAGALMAVSRLEYIFFIDIVTAALAVGLLLLLKVPVHERVRRKLEGGYLADIREGLAYVRKNRTIASLFVFYGAVFFLVVPAAFLSPLLVARTYGDEVWRLTANEIVFFVGSMIGGVVMTAWGGFKNRFRTIGLSCIVWAFMFSGLGLAGVFPLYLFFMFISGIPMPFLNATTTTLLQELTEESMQGRVFGLHQLIMMGIMPLGMLVYGPLADVVSIEVLLVLSSSLMAIPGFWLFFSRKSGEPDSGLLRLRREFQAGD